MNENGLVIAVMDEDGREVELAFPESFLGTNYMVVVKRFDAEGKRVQQDITHGLNLFGAATIREDLVATYKADGYASAGDTEWAIPGKLGWVSIYIGVEER